MPDEMNEMVKRVARAIWSLNEDTDCHDYDQLTPHAKQRANQWAHAAIEAMREPTEAMITAGYVEKHAHHEIPPHRVWLAMIDAALRD